MWFNNGPIIAAQESVFDESESKKMAVFVTALVMPGPSSPTMLLTLCVIRDECDENPT